MARGSALASLRPPGEPAARGTPNKHHSQPAARPSSSATKPHSVAGSTASQQDPRPSRPSFLLRATYGFTNWRRNLSHLVAQLCQLSRPIVRKAPQASIATSVGRPTWQKNSSHRLPAQPLAQHGSVSSGVDAMQDENILRRIHSNSDNLAHGRLPSYENLDKPHSGTIDGRRGPSTPSTHR